MTAAVAVLIGVVVFLPLARRARLRFKRKL